MSKKFRRCITLQLLPPALALVLALSMLHLPAQAISSGNYWTACATQPELSGREAVYLIDSASDLAWLASEVNSGKIFTYYTFRLTSAIDLSGHYWMPIGNTDLREDAVFGGTFDGNGYTISNMTIGSSSEPSQYSYLGLFGSAMKATLKNVLLKDVSINGASGCAEAGALAGHIENCTISGCSSSGNVRIKTPHYASPEEAVEGLTNKGQFAAGGLVGAIYDGDITNCFSSCAVSSSSSYAGGLIGQLWGNAVNCGAAGAVFINCQLTASSLGGLAGWIKGSAYNCFANGSVTYSYDTGEGDSTPTAGGFAGLLEGNMQNCYSSGSVQKEEFYNNGGLVGMPVPHSVITNCYWNSACGQTYSNSRFTCPSSAEDESDFTDKSISESPSYMQGGAFIELLNSFINQNNKINGCNLASWEIAADSIEGYPSLEGVGFTLSPSKISETVTAKPISSAVLVNGSKISFTAYNINGNNYFKLRDLAAALNSSGKQFSVAWDGTVNAIKITSKEAYTKVGGELTVDTNTANASATPTTSAVYLDGTGISLTAYNIAGSNYIKLRDLASVIDFGVSYDSAANTIIIDTSAGY